jgi:hypothetical protein
MVLDHPHSNFSHTEPTQAAKDLISSQDALIDILGRIENFFRRLEEYTEVPTTEAMKDIMVKIMVEVLGIFAIVTKEIKQGRASEWIRDDTLPVAHGDQEKCLKKLIGRRDIEDTLRRLDILTQEEARMATAQVLKLARHVKDGVKSVDDKVDLAIEGALITFISRKYYRHHKLAREQMVKLSKRRQRKQKLFCSRPQTRSTKIDVRHSLSPLP